MQVTEVGQIEMLKLVVCESLRNVVLYLYRLIRRIILVTFQFSTVMNAKPKLVGQA